ncbi:hypothetical protein IQ276_037460 [Desmonostoc muscorum LEGE 12446]|uniref:Uncharacterized protein n=1 Tax=Desmonostoc muscorum LEGE 12446 TaxID=1828758 RepID=A0A8J7DEL9_DESMC|nr:hypothetical protein [Desmonostoc muscorum]MCF2151999.1 hypothetical protein [Desmonostoc muscorum LEGE 12446]
MFPVATSHRPSSLLCVSAIACMIAYSGIAVSKALSTVPDSIAGDLSENSLSCIQHQNNMVSGKSFSYNKAKAENIKINLSNFHQIKLISDNDQRILSVCKQTTTAS